MAWCLHNWEIVGVNRGARYFYNFETGTRVVAGSGTAVLKSCTKCDKTKVEELSGHWTLEELRGRN